MSSTPTTCRGPAECLMCSLDELNIDSLLKLVVLLLDAHLKAQHREQLVQDIDTHFTFARQPLTAARHTDDQNCLDTVSEAPLQVVRHNGVLEARCVVGNTPKFKPQPRMKGPQGLRTLQSCERRLRAELKISSGVGVVPRLSHTVHITPGQC